MTAPASSSATSGCRAGIYGAAGTLLGVLISGPLAVAFVSATRPQPPWQSAEVFARNYHPIQIVPYLGGIVLVAALVALIASIHAMARAEQKVRTQVALVFTGVFATLIFFNYVVQTTFLPELARRYEEKNASIIAAFSMANPTSLAWGIEMWGWGFLGAATWLVAPAFRGSRLERATALTFIANGPASIFGALWTVVRPGWVMTSAGLVAFASWNVLLALMAALALIAFRGRRRGHASAAASRATIASAGSPRPSAT
jgi:hypothetical protein